MHMQVGRLHQPQMGLIGLRAGRKRVQDEKSGRTGNETPAGQVNGHDVHSLMTPASINYPQWLHDKPADRRPA